MFIHWGAFSATARGEWTANRECIPKDEYERLYVENFRAENYAPSEWAALAADAGMRYAVFTTRHHDGFALWPTKTSDFHAGRIGPCRDLVGPFIEAFRAAGLKVGLYFSPADWYHKDYPGAWYRDWPSPKDWKNSEARNRFIAYYRAQLRELLTGYGTIDYLWYDGCIPEDLKCPEANEEALKLHPKLLINERNGPPFHIKISEQSISTANPDALWEACMTLNDNWGYHAGDYEWKNAVQVIKMLLKTSAQGGNLLLNVGPRSDGTIPEPSQGILREVGRWLQRNEEAIRNSDCSPFSWTNWGIITTRASRIFLHIWNWVGNELCITDIANTVKRASYLDGGKSIVFDQHDRRLFLSGLEQIDPLVTTLVLDIEGIPQTSNPQTSFWIPE